MTYTADDFARTTLFSAMPNIPLVKIEDEILSKAGVELSVLRTDLSHDYVSGNKYFKLKYNIIEAKKKGVTKLVTFGGAYSNHIHAISKAAELEGVELIGVIRGEPTYPLNHTLNDAVKHGMKIHYVKRSEYRTKTTAEFLDNLSNIYGEFYLVPEGGSNTLAIAGCNEIPSLINVDFDYICSASGTGGTIAGVTTGLSSDKSALSFPVLKGGEFLKEAISNLILGYDNSITARPQLFTDYHFGGYAKISDELISFILGFFKQSGVLLDPVYTGKMMFGIYDLIKKGFFDRGSKIVALHTGGLQGWHGIIERHKLNIPELDTHLQV